MLSLIISGKLWPKPRSNRPKPWSQKLGSVFPLIFFAQLGPIPRSNIRKPRSNCRTPGQHRGPGPAQSAQARPGPCLAPEPGACAISRRCFGCLASAKVLYFTRIWRRAAPLRTCQCVVRLTTQWLSGRQAQHGDRRGCMVAKSGARAKVLYFTHIWRCAAT